MGYMRHHAIVVSSELPQNIVAAHKKASEIFAHVTPITPPAINHVTSFFVPPDGSKEWWEGSDQGDKRRDTFIAWLRDYVYEDKSPRVDWVEVQFGDDELETTVTRSSDDDRKELP